jgi:hypothetical protein
MKLVLLSKIIPGTLFPFLVLRGKFLAVLSAVPWVSIFPSFVVPLLSDDVLALVSLFAVFLGVLAVLSLLPLGFLVLFALVIFPLDVIILASLLAILGVLAVLLPLYENDLVLVALIKVLLAVSFLFSPFATFSPVLKKWIWGL